LTTNVQPQDLSPREFYHLLISTVAPRPIGWVSTISSQGISNLAPFSFFNALCAHPPLLGFCPGLRSGKVRKVLGDATKDTLRNVRDTGEFVVNVVTFSLAEQMNLTAGDYEASVNEFALARLTMGSSRHVRPPHVVESPVNFECKVVQILDFGSEATGSSLVIGKILSVRVAEELWRDGHLDENALDLIGRMGGTQYCRTTERFEMVRPSLETGQG
jgi:flavin reductase (DIM6/NTAB) family NADH-FMN oxidoreductase RutF